MGTVVPGSNLVLAIPAEILGPGSEYEKRRIELRKEYETILSEARKVTEITSPDVAEHVNNLGRLLQAGTKEAEIFFSPIKQQIDRFKAPVLKDEKEFSGALDEEKRRLGRLITGWNLKCEQERIEAERRSREESERQAREEQLARAVELDASGDHEAAEQLLEEPVFAPVVAQTIAPRRAKGQVGKVYYRAEVTNLMELVKAVASGRAPLLCVQANMTFLNNQADAFKEAFSMPGCKLDRSTSTHFRA